MGISLFDIICEDAGRLRTRLYDRICQRAGNLVRVGEQIESELGIPIVNKRVSVTPISLISAACGDPLPLIRAMDDAAREGRRELHRRLFGAGAKGHDRIRPAADRVAARGAVHD